MSKRKNRVVLLLSLVLLAALAIACGTQSDTSSNNGSPSKAKTAQPPSDKGDQVAASGDLAFMNDAAPGGKAEVELGRLAVKQAASKDVKEFGQRMVDDHSKAGDELMQLARQKKVTLPPEITPKQKEVMDKLAKLAGAEFDREYVKEMVADHEKDVTAFEAVAQNGTDADVKAFAAKTLPTLKDHLRMIREIEGKMSGKAKP